MKTDKKQKRIDGMVRRIVEAREKTDLALPCEAIARTALEGALSSRDGGLLRKAPTFRERPLASLLHRLVAWNQSGGNLWGLFATKQDAATLARFDDSFGAYWHHPKSRMADDKRMIGGLDGDALHDQLETMAMLLCGGSRAADRWKQALGW